MTAERPRHILFVCSQNKLRSPTAERVFAGWPGIEVASAGIDKDATKPVSPEVLQWADVIFVMERAHRNKLVRKFRIYTGDRPVICLNIPDQYDYMDAELIRLLMAVVPKHLTLTRKRL